MRQYESVDYTVIKAVNVSNFTFSLPVYFYIMWTSGKQETIEPDLLIDFLLEPIHSKSTSWTLRKHGGEGDIIVHPAIILTFCFRLDSLPPVTYLFPRGGRCMTPATTV